MREQGAGAPRPEEWWRERAAADGQVLAGLLDAEQRRRRSPGGDRDELARRLGDQRLEVLRTAPRRTSAERESAAAALAADAGLKRLAAREDRAGCALGISGAVLLLTGGAAVLLQDLVLLGIAALACAAAMACLGLQRLWAIALAGRRRRILLDWAADRPGQLGRGLPLLGSVGPVGAPPRGRLFSLPSLLTVFGAVLLGIELWSLIALGPESAETAVVLGGALLLMSGLTALLLRRRSARRARRLDSALEGLPTSTAEEPGAGGSAPDEGEADAGGAIGDAEGPASAREG
jgi:hypothetical protein